MNYTPILIKAQFIGADGFGYKHGETYTLMLIQGSNSIRREDGSGFCPYESIYAFFKNWKPL